MGGQKILQCDLSEQNTFVILFDNIHLLLTGGALLIMLVLQIRAGFPEKRTTKMLLLLAFLVVIFYFLRLLYVRLKNNSDRTRKIMITPEGELITETACGVRSMRYEEILFTMTYTSFHTLAVTYVGNTEYVTARMSNAYLFLKNGKRQFHDFYLIAAFVKENSPHNENIIISRKAKRHPWITIPKGVLETEYYSKRAQKAIDAIRNEYLKRLK